MIGSINVITIPIFISILSFSTQAQSNKVGEVANVSLPPRNTNINNGDDYYHYDANTTSPDEGGADTEEDTRMCKTSTCVRKCCPEGQYLSLYQSHGCVSQKKGDPKFELQFRHKDGRPTVPDKPVHLLYGSNLKLCSTYGLLPEHRDAILLSDGTLYTSHENVHRNASRYCLDVIRRDADHFRMWPITCYEQYQETPRTLFRYYGHAICLILSSVSLLVIIVCHVTLPRLRDLSGLCFLSYAACLLVADVSLLVVSLNGDLPHNLCVFFGIVIHSFFIAAYAWLTVICFDVWRLVMLTVKGAVCPLLQQQERRLFGCYSAVVWGAILVITCTTCTLHFLPQEALPDYVIRPHFGLNRCFIIDEDTNLLAYFFSILAVLALLDVAFIGCTAWWLRRAGVRLCCPGRRVSSSGENGVFNSRDLETFWQRFQIFAMTVVVWTTEVLSWKIPPKEMWEVTDLFNTLQGVILLCIFLHSARNRRLLAAKFRSLAGKSRDEDQGLESRGVCSESSQVSSVKSNDGQSSLPSQVSVKSNDGQSSQPNQISSVKSNDGQSSQPSQVSSVKSNGGQSSLPSQVSSVKSNDGEST